MTIMTKPFAAINSHAIAWRKSDFAPGVSVKDLGESDGQAMQLVQFDPGARFPWHRHAAPEFIYILAGEVIQRGRRLGAGWAGIAPAGTEEDDFMSETGAQFLLVYGEEPGGSK